MARFRRVRTAALGFALVCATAALAQGPKYGLGRPASEQEARTLGATVTPDGRGLPAGRGTAQEGKKVYELRCKECHGAEGRGGEQVGLVGAPSDLLGPRPKKTVGGYWPYATTLWDYTNRAMPFKRPGTLTPDQVYAVTAYILYLNGLIGEEEVIDRQSLPLIRMPNRDGFIPDERPDAQN